MSVQKAELSISVLVENENLKTEVKRLNKIIERAKHRIGLIPYSPLFYLSPVFNLMKEIKDILEEA